MPFLHDNYTKRLRLGLFAGLAVGLLACGSEDKAPSSLAGGENAAQQGDMVIAKINGTELYRSDVEFLAMSQGIIDENTTLPVTDPQFKTTLDELIDQRLLALDAERKSLDQDPDTRRRLQAARERILGNIRVEQHLKEVVNETTIRRMYEEQTAMANRGQERRARHILVEDEDTAKEIFKQLEDGADFAKLAREKSMDPGSSAKGGDLDFFSRDMLDRDFTGPVFKADIGDRIPPFKTEFGWHVVEVLDRRVPDQPGFEELRPEIVNFMTFDAIESLISDLREEAEVELLLQNSTTNDSVAKDEDTDDKETE